MTSSVFLPYLVAGAYLLGVLVTVLYNARFARNIGAERGGRPVLLVARPSILFPSGESEGELE